MADPLRMQLIMTPQGPLELPPGVEDVPLDQSYAASQGDLRWQANLEDPELNGTAEAGMGAATPEQIAGVPAPVAAPAPAPSASPLMAGAKAAFQAVGQVAENTLQGLAKGLVQPILSPGQIPVPAESTAPGAGIGTQFGGAAVGLLSQEFEAAKQLAMAGLGAIFGVPAAALSAMTRQELENRNPGALKMEAFSGGPAGVIRMAAGQGNPLEPDKYPGINNSMSVDELLDLAIQNAWFALPGAAKAMRKFGKTLREQKGELLGERGALGPAEPGAPRPPSGGPEEGPAPGGGAAPPPGEPEMRLNVGRVNASDRVKQVMADLNRVVGERLLAEHREVVTHEQTKAEASRYTLQQILATDPATTPIEAGRPIQQALRDYFNATATELEQRLRALPEGPGRGPGPEFYDLFATAVKLAELDERFGAGFARGTEARKIQSEAAAAGKLPTGAAALPGFKPEDILRLSEQVALQGHRPEDIVQGLSMLTKPQQRGWLAQVGHAALAGRDLFHEAWINALLSSPVTHASNVIGTGLSTLWELPERYTAEFVNRLFTRDPDGIQRGETAAMVRNVVSALEDGMRFANKAWETGQEPLGPERVETRSVTAEHYGFDPDSLVGRTLDTLGAGLRAKGTPLRGMLAEDAFFKGVNYRMEISAQALRQGLQEGKQGAALERRVTELMNQPTVELTSRAQDAAALRTMNAELGPAGQAFMQWANQIPGGRVVLPFIRTPTNMLKWTGERTPGLSLIWADNMRAIREGGAARDRAIAKIALGHAVGAVIAYEVAQGNITGNGPDPAQKKYLAPFQSCPPNSIKAGGGSCVQYDRGLDPVAGLIGAVADFAELQSQIPDQDLADEVGAYAQTIGMALGQVFVNKTYLQGLANVLDTIKDPERSSGSVVRGFARSLVPAAVRQTARVADDNIAHDVQTVVDAIKSGIPGLSAGVPVVRNPVTGEPIRLPAGWGPDMISPVLVSAKKEDPVFDAIVANKIQLLPVGWYVAGGKPSEGPETRPVRANEGVKLTPQEHDYWITAMTQEVTNGKGQTLYEALSDLVASDKYRVASSGPEGGQQYMIRQMYSVYKEAGYEKLLKESPELLRDVKDKQRGKLEQLLPTTNPRSPQYQAPGAAPPAPAPSLPGRVYDAIRSLTR